MEQRFDLDSWLAATQPLPRQGRAGGLEWAGLAARLAAGHAFQRAQAEGEGAWLAPAGSFDPVAARQLIEYAMLIEGGRVPLDWEFDGEFDREFDPGTKSVGYTGVNPIASGDGKNKSGNHAFIAGLFPPAIEG